jgi:diguanylate cyclase (GGDEF)-like protein
MGFAVLKGREFRLLLLMSALVLACAWASSRLSSDSGGAGCIWIANAVIMAFVLTAPRRWKIAFAAVGLCAELAVDLAWGTPVVEALWFLFCNAAEVLLAVTALGHLTQRGDITSKRALCRIAYFGMFLAPLIAALLGAPVEAIIEGRPWLEVLRLWFLGESLGIAASLLPMLFLLTAEKQSTQERGRSARDMVVWASPLAALTAVVFWQTKYPVVFLLFPPLIAVLFRFRLAGAVYGSSLFLILAAALTAEGHGPFRLFPGAPPMEQVMLFHIFGLTLFATAIAVGFLIEERYRFARALKNANAKLSELAFRDSLTGLPNRRSLDESLELTWSKAIASGSALSLLYIDIDFFKRFNDGYGHQGGDDCLRAVGEALAQCVRGSGDHVARYGGEEFVILLSDTSRDSALDVAARAAGSILSLEISHRASPFGVISASFGVATMCPCAGGAPSDLIRLADRALYRAKSRGRNRIEACAELATPDYALA